MHIFLAATYDKLLHAEIASATKRIYVSAMVIMAGQRTDQIFSGLRQALHRGIKVVIVYDIFGFRSISRMDTISQQEFAREVARTKALFEELKQLGATIIETKSIAKNPFKGVNHIKLVVIDDTVHSFGGINIVDIAFRLTDYMIITEDSALAEYCVSLFQKLSLSTFKNEEWSHDSYKVLIDGGESRKSLIYDRACELTEQAAAVYYVSAFQPTGRLAKLLQAGNTTCYFNRPEQLAFASKLAYIIDRFRRQGEVANAYQRTNYLHAKCMLFEFASGKRVVLSGSHNFDWRGVLYGTKEIALETTDPTMCQEVYDFIQHEVA
jgi:phosphatidylserine/phosphatidylglycerophosphate/cardiolipin synthase-like enzyme